MSHPTSENAVNGTLKGSYKVVETLFDDPANRPLKAIGIGCGISGVMMAYKIQKECQNVELAIYDKNADLGGTWFENRYPGAGCDIPSHAYSFNFALNPEWPNYCSFGEDIRGYLNKVAEVFDLRKFMQFRSEVVSCEWKEKESKWEVTIHQVDSKEVTHCTTETSDILLYATGVLNNTKWPAIDGLKKFKGKIIHTSAWPEDYQKEQWSNERIAVLGSGASSFQTVPGMQPDAKGLDVFVRSGAWFNAIVENFGIYHPYSAEERENFRNDPKALVEHTKALENQMAWAVDMMTRGSQSQLEARKFFADRFLPPWGVGCRRITPGDPYMKAIQEPNVRVHFTAAKSLTEDGIIGEDGVERKVDTVVCATGFDTSYRPRFPVIGQNGINLGEKWKDEPNAYMGITVPDMPNFYMFMGPAWPVHNGSVMGPLVQVGNYIVDCIHKMQRENIKSLTPRADATAAFNIHVQEWLERTVWTEDCRSWFKNKGTGRVDSIWPGSGLHYAEAISTPRFEDYRIEYKYENQFSYLGSGFTLAEKTEYMDSTPFLAEDKLDPKWVAAFKDFPEKKSVQKPSLQLAFLGIGSMGKAMTKNLVEKGNLSKPIILWNRSTSRAIEHSNNIGSSSVEENLEEAIYKSDIIWSCFSDQKAVLDSFNTILSYNIRGKLFLECSTISPEATNELAQKFIDAGAEFVAMPVFGEPSMANAGILTCLPAGKPESVDRILPYLKGVIARSVINLSGSTPGTASHTKLIGNVLIVQMIESVAEAHVLAEKTNLKGENVHKVIESVFPGPFAIYSERMMSGKYYKEEPIVSIGMAKNVASYVQSLAKKSGTELAAYKIGCEHLDLVEKRAGKDGDISGIYGSVRVESGLEFEN